MACRLKRETIGWLAAAAAVFGYAYLGWGVGAEFWYKPLEITINDSLIGGDPRVHIKREIYRNFSGEYSVGVWQEPTDGHVICAGSDRLRYKGGLFRPHEDSLSHWSNDPRCALLPAGKYYAEACWTVLRPFGGLVPSKTTCSMSNIFTVYATEQNFILAPLGDTDE